MKALTIGLSVIVVLAAILTTNAASACNAGSSNVGRNMVTAAPRNVANLSNTGRR